MWGIPEDLLRLLQKWPRLADYIDADEQRSRALREITEATLCVSPLAVCLSISLSVILCVWSRVCVS